jgi:drug/metabolite transporter (DMT)-like permease
MSSDASSGAAASQVAPASRPDLGCLLDSTSRRRAMGLFLAIPGGVFLLSSGANGRGIAAIICGMAAFSISDVFTKLVALTHPLGEVFAVRGLFTAALVGAAMIVMGDWRSWHYALSKGVLARSLLDATSSALYVAALVHLPLTDITAIVLLSPLIVTMIAVAFFREKVDARRWLAVLVGFAGVLFIVRPAPASFNAWGFIALGAAMANSLRDVLTRRLDPAIPTTVLTLTSMIALTLVGVGLSLSGAWLPFSAYEYMLLFCGAIFFGLAVYFVALAFRGGEISVVAPFRYTSLLWAGIAGYVAFNEIPDAWSLAGAALIVASGLYVLHRDSIRSRKPRGVAASP